MPHPDTRIQVSGLSPAERRAIELAAQSRHMKIAAFARQQLLDAAAALGFTPAPDTPPQQAHMPECASEGV